MKPAQMLAMVLTALLVFYPLSPGPVVLYYKRANQIPPKVVANFYAPLDWLYEHNTTIAAAYRLYFRAWGVG